MRVKSLELAHSGSRYKSLVRNLTLLLTFNPINVIHVFSWQVVFFDLAGKEALKSTRQD